MQDLVIDYDSAKDRFLLAAPTWMFQTIQKIPYRKWDKRTRTFFIPAVGRNLDALSQHFGAARWTSRAKDALIAADQNRQIAKRRASGFPASYPFKRLPLDHQRRALDHAYGSDGTGLFMEMRTGKTKVIIDIYSQYFIEGKINGALIVCPMSARHVWRQALEDDCPVGFSVVFCDSTGKALDMFKYSSSHGEPFRWLIASVESFSSGGSAKVCEQFLLGHKAAMAVDESSKIKNHSAIRSKVCTKLGRYAQVSRDILNGTPGAISNGIEDLYQQFEFIDPAIIGIGDFYSFRNRYCEMGGYEGRQIVGYKGLDELMPLLAPHVFEVRKTDALPQLAGRKIGPVKRMVKLSEQQRAAYKSIQELGMAEVAGGVVEVRMILEEMLRLQQIVSGHISRRDAHPFNKKRDGSPEIMTSEFDIEGKNPKIEELLEVIEQNEGSMVVWSRFNREIDKICARLRAQFGHDQVVEFHGRVDEETRNENKRKFQNGEARFLVVNQMSGSMSIELSRARTMVYMSNTFSFIDRNQSEERPFSKNLEHSVLVVDIVAEGTVDETIQEAIRTKADMAEYVRLELKKHSAQELLEGACGKSEN